MADRGRDPEKAGAFRCRMQEHEAETDDETLERQARREENNVVPFAIDGAPMASTVR